MAERRSVGMLGYLRKFPDFDWCECCVSGMGLTHHSGHISLTRSLRWNRGSLSERFFRSGRDYAYEFRSLGEMLVFVNRKTHFPFVGKK